MEGYFQLNPVPHDKEISCACPQRSAALSLLFSNSPYQQLALRGLQRSYPFLMVTLLPSCIRVIMKKSGYMALTRQKKNQEYGQKAKNLTSALVAGRNIDVETKEVDRYGRTVGLVSVDGKSLNELIVKNGYAWVYEQFCKEQFCVKWIKLEEKARQQKKGLWAGSNIIAPWDWRRQPKEPEKLADEAPIIIIGAKGQREGDGLGGRNSCDGRTYCSQMTSCAEATFFMKNCPGTKMDGDNDGVPCEKQWCR
jgi:hypothetical protein